MSVEPIPEATRRYTGVAIALHWAIALGIIGMIAGGWYMGDLPDGPQKTALYQLHKSIGITILILTIARILWRVMNPPPPEPDSLKTWEKTASGLAHFGFYALMILMPLTGWLYVSTAYDFDIPTVLYGVVSWPDIPFVGHLKNQTANGAIEFVHSKLAWVAIGLLVLHVAGAVKHEFGPEEGVIKRMAPGLFGPTSSPRPPAKGFLMAFGSALAVFAVIAAVPLLQTGAASPQLEREAAAPSGSAAWTVDYDNSAISFAFSHEGNAYDGAFSDWTADIVFDPDNPEAAEVTAEIATGSATTGVKMYDDALPGSEWFFVREYPTASVRVFDFARGDNDNTWTAEAEVAIKDMSLIVPFDFTLDIDGDRASMTGEATLFRSPLNLGMQSDPNAAYVSEEVDVTVTIEAMRAE